MGIRIHKYLGYGLTDVGHSSDGYHLADERINAGALDWERLGGPERLDEYAAWLTAREGDDKAQNVLRLPILDRWWLRDRGEQQAREARRDLEDCVVWRGEYGLPGVLLVQPLGCGDWSRFDDPIDWVEETHLHQNAQANRVTVLRHGLHPFSGTYMDTLTGQKLPDDVMWWVRATNPGEARDPGTLDALAAEFGMTHAQATERVRPVVPGEVRDICEFTGLFTGPDVWRQLRPILYVRWG